MKYLDKVKLLNNKDEYKKQNVFASNLGRIISAEIRENCFLVDFIDENFEVHKNDAKWFETHLNESKEDVILPVDIADLEVVQESDLSNAEILKDLPKQDPHWWCKVENGFILNLLGEKKNKIAYDYRS